MKSIIILSLIIWGNTSFGQISADSVSTILSGSDHKEWVASPWKHVMGNSNKKCNGGESYIFYENKKVESRKCVNGTIQKKTFEWEVVREGNNNFLYIGNDKYQIRPKTGSESELKLRVLVGDKINLSNEVILKYERY